MDGDQYLVASFICFFIGTIGLLSTLAKDPNPDEDRHD
jgi:hypothetical protein